MCGILGIWTDDSSLNAVEAAERGVAALVHRGPDDCGMIHLGLEAGRTLVFGHRRLSIIDLSPGGHQPMSDPNTGNYVVYNGELYNFRALRTELESGGYQFASNSDTEVILKSYAAWGPDCVKRWRGMFAVAIWDSRR